MKRIKHIKGLFPAINYLPWFGRHKHTIYFYVNFDKESEYMSEDQEDYLKACGISFNPILSSRNNSAMLGYRYNPELDQFFTTIYWHDENGTRNWIEELEGKEFCLTVVKSYIELTKLSNIEERVRLRYKDMGIKPSKWYRTIQPWAGGNTKPQNNFSFRFGSNI